MEACETLMDVHRECSLKEQEQAPIRQPKRPLEGIMTTWGSNAKPCVLLRVFLVLAARSNRMMIVPPFLITQGEGIQLFNIQIFSKWRGKAPGRIEDD